MKDKKVKKEITSIRFPENLIAPIRKVLTGELKELKEQKKKIDDEDPFKDASRVTNNAAPDTEADEQFGHARTSAIKEQIDRNIIQLRKALSRIKIGKYGICENCGQMIDTDRLMIYPEATRCVKCESKR